MKKNIVKIYLPWAFRLGIEDYIVGDDDFIGIDNLIEELTLCFKAQVLGFDDLLLMKDI